MSSLVVKKSAVAVVFVLFSLVFLGIVMSLTSDIAIKAGDELSYPSWLVIAYVAGLSMIVLPCTLPLVFIIVPLSMGQGYRKGLAMSLLFGAGLVVTISLYGLGVAYVGKSASLDQISTAMFAVAGIAGYFFGLSQLKLVKFGLPSYSRTPSFIQKRGDHAKSFLMGVLLGNAGVGCPNPMFYWLLIYVAGTGSLEIGGSLGIVHGVGRAVPLVIFSLLAILGVNAARGLAQSRIKIEKITGWMLVTIGAFLIINGVPGGHEWYESTMVHIVWNNLVSMTGLPAEYHVGYHTHDNVFGFELPQNVVPAVFALLLAVPVVWYAIKVRIGENKT
ncbi:MAG: cytochrome c biogenesis protein CcdA [Candidatus Nitrosotenuis sp.]